MAAKLTYLFNLKDKAFEALTVDQISSSVIFGSGGIIGWYNSDISYRPGDIAIYMTEDGTIKTMICVTGQEGGPLDESKWREYSLLDNFNVMKNEYVVLSPYRPENMLYNKIWLQLKTDVVIGGANAVYNLIVANNFVISPSEPNPFATDIVWGQVTSN